eukprot:553436_1
MEMGLIHIHILLYCMILTYSLSNRGGILVATYSEIVSIHKQNSNINNSDTYLDYFSKPLIITQSPMTNWTLNEEDIYDIYDDTYNFECAHKITNCSCIEEQSDVYNDRLCEEFASAFLYAASAAENYSHWKPFEVPNKLSRQLQKCITASITPISLSYAHKMVTESLINSYSFENNIKIADEMNPEIYNKSRNEFKKYYPYTRILAMKPNDNNETYIESQHLNLLDRIRLSAYFKIFNIAG